MESQAWDDDEFCDTYEQTWELSEQEVHYGWLAPGENTLKLVEGICLQGANVLDVGCGLGQNLITKNGVREQFFLILENIPL